MAETHSKDSVLLLTKDNLPMWMIDIRAELRRRDLWDYVEGSYVSKITDPSTATERQRISDETNRQK